MKKVLIIILCLALIFCAAACASKDVKVKSKAFEMTREELTEALDGVKEDELLEWWGTPSSFFSGLYGSIWELDGRYISVVFDYDTKVVEGVACGELDENGFIS